MVAAQAKVADVIVSGEYVRNQQPAEIPAAPVAAHDEAASLGIDPADKLLAGGIVIDPAFS